MKDSPVPFHVSLCMLAWVTQFFWGPVSRKNCSGGHDSCRWRMADQGDLCYCDSL